MSTATTSVARPRPLPAVVDRVRGARDSRVLVGVVALAAGARFVAALPHTTPRYFPDEYLYATLARSIGHGSLTVRGEPAHFPALLESLVTAPLWLGGGVATPFRLVQLLHAVVAALAVVPVYLLARRIGLPRGQRLACAALVPVLPVFLLASYLTADVLGATLALTALATGVAALVEPRRRLEIAFLALAGLAALARFQYVVLIPALALAALAVSGDRPWRSARRFPVLSAALVTAALVGVGLGPARLLGYYDSLLQFHLSVPSAGRWAATDLLFVGYASGIALGPLALLGLAGALRRPRSAGERAFGALTAAFLALVLLEAVLYATNGSARFQERYFMSVLPLVAPLACLGLRRAGSRAAKIWLAASTLALLLVAARLPVSDYTVDNGDQDSPFLHAVAWLDRGHGHGTAGLVVAAVVSVAVVVSWVGATRIRGGATVVLGVAAVVLATTSIVAIREDAQRSVNTRALALAADPRWIDRSGLGPVSTLVPRDALRWVISEQLFWNRSISRVLTMPGAPDADAFQNARVHVDARGILREGTRTIGGPLLVQEYSSSVQLEGADLVSYEGTAALFRPQPGGARFVSITDGRYLDGWLGWPSAQVTVWPEATGPRRGVLCLPLSLPDFGSPVTLDLRAPGYRRTVTLAAGGSLLVAIPRTVDRPWPLRIAARRPFRIGARLLSARVETPLFITGKASASACR